MDRLKEAQQLIDTACSMNWDDEAGRAALFDKALAILNPHLEQNVGCLEGLQKRSQINWQLERYQDAEPDLLKLVESGAGELMACMRLVDVYKGLGNYQAALEYQQKVIDLDGRAGIPRYRYDTLAELLGRLGRKREAKAAQQVYDEYESDEQAKWDDPNHYYHYK